MTAAPLVLGFVTLQRLGELVLARHNTRRLIARGAVESGAGHYPLLVALHAVWLGGLWALAWDRPTNVTWLVVYGLLQLLRAWTLVSLGPRWTTRIVTLPGAPLVRRGPYRLLPHPNYLVVVGEIAVLPLVFGLAAYALVFSLLNAAALCVRIPAEAAALRAAQGPRGWRPL